MIVAFAILMALCCALASARRLWFVANATAVHPDDVVAWLGRSPPASKLAELREAVAAEPRADWERDLLDALAQPNVEARVALVNEQLTELDRRMQRWARVPRVCASVATSFAILLGTLVLRSGFAAAPELSGELGERFVRQIVGAAVSVASFGVVGTAFCIAAHSHARRMTRARQEAADRMIEALEALADASRQGTGPAPGAASAREPGPEE
ncbi:MAG: hypothetical protein KF782_09870 [Labilithrix sp.]|nr:hypothetical protein [Labilithrix sp.]